MHRLRTVAKIMLHAPQLIEADDDESGQGQFDNGDDHV
jgi:hypothetical protein